MLRSGWRRMEDELSVYINKHAKFESRRFPTESAVWKQTSLFHMLMKQPYQIEEKREMKARLLCLLHLKELIACVFFNPRLGKSLKDDI